MFVPKKRGNYITPFVFQSCSIYAQQQQHEQQLTLHVADTLKEFSFVNFVIFITTYF